MRKSGSVAGKAPRREGRRQEKEGRPRENPRERRGDGEERREPRGGERPPGALLLIFVFII